MAIISWAGRILGLTRENKAPRGEQVNDSAPDPVDEVSFQEKAGGEPKAGAAPATAAASPSESTPAPIETVPAVLSEALPEPAAEASDAMTLADQMALMQRAQATQGRTLADFSFEDGELLVAVEQTFEAASQLAVKGSGDVQIVLSDQVTEPTIRSEFRARGEAESLEQAVEELENSGVGPAEVQTGAGTTISVQASKTESGQGLDSLPDWARQSVGGVNRIGGGFQASTVIGSLSVSGDRVRIENNGDVLEVIGPDKKVKFNGQDVSETARGVRQKTILTLPAAPESLTLDKTDGDISFEGDGQVRCQAATQTGDVTLQAVGEAVATAPNGQVVVERSKSAAVEATSAQVRQIAQNAQVTGAASVRFYKVAGQATANDCRQVTVLNCGSFQADRVESSLVASGLSHCQIEKGIGSSLEAEDVEVLVNPGGVGSSASITNGQEADLGDVSGSLTIEGPYHRVSAGAVDSSVTSKQAASLTLGSMGGSLEAKGFEQLTVSGRVKSSVDIEGAEAQLQDTGRLEARVKILSAGQVGSADITAERATLGDVKGSLEATVSDRLETGSIKGSAEVEGGEIELGTVKGRLEGKANSLTAGDVNSSVDIEVGRGQIKTIKGRLEARVSQFLETGNIKSSAEVEGGEVQLGNISGRGEFTNCSGRIGNVSSSLELKSSPDLAHGDVRGRISKD